MTYDAADGYVLLFSGSSQTQTWTFADGVWTSLGAGPPPRVGASMTYDARDGYVVLFGGTGSSSGGYKNTTYWDDTWTFVHGAWTNVTPARVTASNMPSRRYDASMTYDSEDHVVVLFGGDYLRTFLSDTWEFSGGSWTNVTSVSRSAPSCRFGAGMADDPVDGFVLLFGGDGKKPGGCGSGTNNLTLADSWSFVDGRWTQLSPVQSPPAAWAASMVFDAQDGYVLLFGGIWITDMASGQTWEFSHDNWTEITPVSSPPTSPPARFSASIAYDGQDGYVVLFAGLSEPQKGAPLLQDVWTYQAGTWRSVTGYPLPSPARVSMAMTYDQKDGYVLLFGGLSGTAALADTWKYVGGSWLMLKPPVSPSARYGASMTYDDSPNDDFVVLFGGRSGANILGDTWEFTRGIWTNLTNASRISPSPRYNSAMTFDSNSKVQSVVLFGGEGPSGALRDTWLFSNGNWSEANSSKSPPARWNASLAYDAASSDRYVVLFGGLNGSQIFGDTWEFGNSLEWSGPIGVSGPSPRYGAGLVYDSADGYLLLFGGANASSVLGDTWSYSQGLWKLLPSSPSPSPRSSPGMAYDVVDSLAVLFGGAGAVSSKPPLEGDAWVFSAGTWLNISLGPGLPPPNKGTSTLSLGVLGVDGLVLVVATAVGVALFAVIFVRRRRRYAPPRSGTQGPSPQSAQPSKEVAPPPPQR